MRGSLYFKANATQKVFFVTDDVSSSGGAVRVGEQQFACM